MSECELIVTKIFFPKETCAVGAKTFTIFNAKVKTSTQESLIGKDIRIKQTTPIPIELGLIFSAALKSNPSHPTYGESYQFILKSSINKPISKDITTYEPIPEDKENSSYTGDSAFLARFVSDGILKELNLAHTRPVKLFETGDIEELTKIKGIGKATATRLLSKYGEHRAYQVAYTRFVAFGFTSNLIMKIVDYFHSPSKAVSSVMNNPFELTKIDGIGFKTVDEIACKSKMDNYEEKRIIGFIRYFLNTGGESGKSWQDYSVLVKAAKEVLGPVSGPDLIKELDKMVSNGEVIRLPGNKFAMKAHYTLEHKLFEEIKRLYLEYEEPSELFAETNDAICLIEKEQGITLTDKQKEAITLSSKYGVMAITGLAGTGKTTAAYGICKAHEGKRIIAIALSGKASVRISEVTGIEPCTVHKALAYNHGRYKYNKENPLTVDVVLVDESTMVNGDIFLALMEAIPTGAKLIMFGDIEQLTPIGNCNVFADVLNSNIIPSVKLIEPHRQALRSGMIPLSIQVAHQQQLFDKSYKGHVVVGELQDMELDIDEDSDKLCDKVVTYFKSELKKQPNIVEVQIITPMRSRGSLSCYAINTKIQEAYNPGNNDCVIEVALDPLKANSKKYQLKLSDKVINTKNNYTTENIDGEITPIFNGNIGIITKISKESCIVDFMGIGEIVLDLKGIAQLELAYAISIHKAQGSGFEHAIVAIDNGSYILNNTELLYTGLTRAKRHCILVAQNQAIRKAIRTKETMQRKTLLLNLLINNAEYFAH